LLLHALAGVVERVAEAVGLLTVGGRSLARLRRPLAGARGIGGGTLRAGDRHAAAPFLRHRPGGGPAAGLPRRPPPGAARVRPVRRASPHDVSRVHPAAPWRGRSPCAPPPRRPRRRAAPPAP